MPSDNPLPSNSKTKKFPPKVANSLMPYWLKTEMEARKDLMDQNPFLTKR